MPRRAAESLVLVGFPDKGLSRWLKLSINLPLAANWSKELQRFLPTSVTPRFYSSLKSSPPPHMLVKKNKAATILDFLLVTLAFKTLFLYLSCDLLFGFLRLLQTIASSRKCALPCSQAPSHALYIHRRVTE